MRKVLAFVVIGAILGALTFVNRNRIEEHFSCAELVMQQAVTQSVVKGAYNCLDPDTQFYLKLYANVKNAQDFAVFDGIPARCSDTVSICQAGFEYLGKTTDGGYAYQLHALDNPHNELSAAWNDINYWWKFHNSGSISIQDLGLVLWQELNGETQGNLSQVLTIYLYPPGSNVVALTDGKVYNVSGKVEAVI